MENATRSDWFGTRTSGRGSFPPVNVFSEGDDYVVVAELPQGSKKRTSTCRSRAIRYASKARRSVEQSDGVSVHRRERAEGQFDRTLSFPAQLNAAKAAADYRDGVLTLRLPRAESEKARSVTIA